MKGTQAGGIHRDYLLAALGLVGKLFEEYIGEIGLPEFDAREVLGFIKDDAEGIDGDRQDDIHHPAATIK
jgi:hypothetical protein